MNNHYKKGEATAVIMTVLVLVLITALGWIFYQNFIYKAPANSDSVDVVTRTDSGTGSEAKTKADGDTTGKSTYIDYRKDGRDSSGVRLETEADVDRLTNAGAKLKSYLVGEVNGGSSKVASVDRVYGDYAVGDSEGFYSIWGPEGGSGAIKSVAGTQNLGFKCSDLEAAKVPSKLVDGKCYSFDGGVDNTPQDYTVDPYQ
ncbi:hypothetical protein H6796_02585 [Candidatus Nomurabacteria bacterium]|nr:hypothetical protein [Candidatus Nomurabacteria bacterium]